MILNDITISITAKTAEAIITNNVAWSTFFFDKNPSLSDPRQTLRGTFDNAGTANIVTVPTSSGPTVYVKEVMEIFATNTDTVTHLIEFFYSSTVGGVLPILIFKANLLPGESVSFINGKGWVCTAADGSIKTVFFNGTKPKKIVRTNDSQITPDCDNGDINKQANAQAMGNLTMNAPTGTPADGQLLQIELSSVNVQTFVWDAIYEGSVTTALPTVSSGANKTDNIFFQYDATLGKWLLINFKLGYT